jgi:choline-sulfatase
MTRLRAPRLGDSRLVRAFLWFWLLALVILMRPDTGPRRVRAERQKSAPARGPNLLILIADDHAGDTLGIDGDPRQATPSIDALARQGVRFNRAFCNAPVCTASRQSVMTGRLPHSVGVTQLGTRLSDDVVTLGDWLGDLGYSTAAYGKMHFNGPSHHGFQDRLDSREWNASLKAHPPEGGDHRPPWRPFRDPASIWLNSACLPAGLPAASMESTFYADRAIEFLGRHKDRPFALVVSFYDPHSPFKFPREWQGKFRPDQFSVPPVSDTDRREQPEIFASLTPDEVKGIQAAYFTSMSFMDNQLGRVVAALDTMGLDQNTIVVYFGDNGYMRGHHGRFEKHCFYEPAVRVPLVMRWPGRLPKGQARPELVELIDVLPTVLDLMGVSHLPEIQGRSLVPLLRGEPGASGREFVFSEYTENEEAMVRSARHKLIVGTGRRLRQDGYQTAQPLPGPYEKLFDLESDPGETTNLSQRPELAEIKARLRHQMYERLVTTRLGLDPLPARLTEIEAIHWCLVPRDDPEH